MKNNIVLSKEVKQALADSKPVVAFESTIITYGLPYPQNLQTALEVEDIARKNGATPATISVIDGKIMVGADKKLLKYIADPKNKPSIDKVSRHNFSCVLGEAKSGVTTVAATMMVCQACGIKVFVTGGIGGVHRGGAESFDISADLREFEKSKVAVVASGVKSILDIKLTLEYLETAGVTVIGYKCGELPAFYSRKSGYKITSRVDSIEKLAQIVDINFNFSKSGLLITNPIPAKDEINSNKISALVDEIISAANPEDIEGPKYTPYILEKLHEISAGKTLKANVALIKSNAELGSKLASSLAKLTEGSKKIYGKISDRELKAKKSDD